MEDFKSLSDEGVLHRMDALARGERRAIADALACLAEVDRRRAYGPRAFHSIFDYCFRHLKLSRGAAYRRVQTARAADRFLEIYADIQDGNLSMCVVAMLVQRLGLERVGGALPYCRGKSKDEVEEWLARQSGVQAPLRDRVAARPALAARPSVYPAPPAKAAVNPAPLATDLAAVNPAHPETDLAAVNPAHPETDLAVPRSLIETIEFVPPDAPAPSPDYEYSFRASAELHSSIERLKDLLWSKFPFGTLDEFLTIAVVEYLERHDPELRLTFAPEAPARRVQGRRVPRSVRNSVWARDGGRCVFVSADGRRCSCRRGLELDHVVPYSAGGRSDDPANIRLLCREHNQLERRRILGEGAPFGAEPGERRPAPA